MMPAFRTFLSCDAHSLPATFLSIHTSSPPSLLSLCTNYPHFYPCLLYLTFILQHSLLPDQSPAQPCVVPPQPQQDSPSAVVLKDYDPDPPPPFTPPFQFFFGSHFSPSPLFSRQGPLNCSHAPLYPPLHFSVFQTQTSQIQHGCVLQYITLLSGLAPRLNWREVACKSHSMQICH